MVLSGCGFKDGTEITEAVSSIISLSQLGAELHFFAPRIEFTSTHHLTGEPGEARDTLVESARITRGHIQEISQLNPQEFDGLVFPGGFGAALHLCNFAQKGAQCTVESKVEEVIETFHLQSKPIAAICIAPALIARVLGSHHVHVTIGNDKDTAKEIEKTGAQHVECPVSDFVTDRENKVVTTPAYMYSPKPHEVFEGIQKTMKEFYEMA